MSTALETREPLAAANTPQWHEARGKGIGASEAAAACGLSKWELPLELWAKKVHGHSTEESDAMKAGTLLEPVLSVLLQRETGVQIAKRGPGVYQHAEHEWMLASPDGLMEDGALAELKSTTTRNDQLGEEDTDEIPTEWLLQCQQQMAVCDAQRVHVMVLYRDKVPLGWLLETVSELSTEGHVDLSQVDYSGWASHYVVDRNDRLIESMIKREREFWQHVLDKTPPPFDFEHTHAARAVRNAFRQVSEGETVELSPEIQFLWEKYQMHSEREKEAKKEKEAITARVLMEIQNAQTGILPSGAQLRRTLVAGGHVSYERKPYVRLSYRKAK